MGDGSANFTYLFDDVKLISTTPTGTQMNLPVTFDLPTVNYGLVGFGGADASTIEADPVVPSNKVAKVIRSATAETWAGTTITTLSGAVQIGFSSKIPFAASEKRMNVRVYSPTAGIPVRLKVEDYLDNTKTCETEATTTTANAWKTLTFDFGSPATGTATLNLANSYNKVSIFFNFGVAGSTAGEKTYYFDDIQFGPATSVQGVKEMPESYSLSQNYPNPFNPSTQISYSIQKSGMVSLKVYDVVGREVMSVVNGYQDAGSYVATVNTTGAKLASGIYIYRLSVVPLARRDLVPTEGWSGQAGPFTALGKMMLLK